MLISGVILVSSPIRSAEKIIKVTFILPVPRMGSAIWLLLGRKFHHPFHQRDIRFFFDTRNEYLNMLIHIHENFRF